MKKTGLGGCEGWGLAWRLRRAAVFMRPRILFPTLRWTLSPVIVTIRDSQDYIGALLYSYFTTITGWGVLLGYLLGVRLYMGPGSRGPGLQVLRSAFRVCG